MKLKKSINPEIKQKLKDAYFIGRLVNEEDITGTMIKEPVYFKNEHSGEIQFHIKCLSPIPDEVKENFYYPNNIITGSTISNNNYYKLSEMMHYDRLHHFEKKDKVKQFLINKLIVFKLTVKAERIYVEIVNVEENRSPDKKIYAVIPGPELKIDETKKDFEEKITGIRKPITLPLYPNIFSTPEFIYYQNTLYKVLLKKSLNTTTYIQVDTEDVKYHPSIDEFFIEHVVARIDDLLYFIPYDKLPDLRDYTDEYGSLNENYHYNVESSSDDEIDSYVNIENDSENLETKHFKSEIDFLKLLEENAKRRGLYYNKKDLYSFHISVKTNLLTIIGGMSGTGKSQLAKLYGETMGLQYGKELLMIPVSPSYHEPNDVLGYLNPTTGIYYESETGLVNLLLDAEESPERLYMVIFDEMNLSQVEHWFSPFISLLEIDEGNRHLSLFNDNSYCVNPKYKSKVKVGNNVIFIGTVNFDETTKDFSDRLLDRTNVIVPEKLTFKKSLEILRTQEETNERMESLGIQSLGIQTKIFKSKWYRKQTNNQALSIFTEDEINLLDNLHAILNEEDRQKGVSFRVVIGIASFIANIPKEENDQLLIERSEAFDIQLAQRVLTKINGISSYVEPLVGRIENGEYKPGLITELLTSGISRNVSEFTYSIELLKSKAKELNTYGYAK